MIAFDLPLAFRVERSAEDQFNAVFMSFRFKCFSDKLLPIIEIKLLWDSAGAKHSTESVDR